MVHDIISESLKEEINLTIIEKIKGKSNKSEFKNFTHQPHKEIKIGNNDIDKVLISISFHMRWQNKEPGILTIQIWVTLVT